MSSYVKRNLNDETGKNMVWCFNCHAGTFSFDTLINELVGEGRNITSLELPTILGNRRAREAPEERFSRMTKIPTVVKMSCKMGEVFSPFGSCFCIHSKYLIIVMRWMIYHRSTRKNC